MKGLVGAIRSLTPALFTLLLILLVRPHAFLHCYHDVTYHNRLDNQGIALLEACTSQFFPARVDAHFCDPFFAALSHLTRCYLSKSET